MSSLVCPHCLAATDVRAIEWRGNCPRDACRAAHSPARSRTDAGEEDFVDAVPCAAEGCERWLVEPYLQNCTRQLPLPFTVAGPRRSLTAIVGIDANPGRAAALARSVAGLFVLALRTTRPRDGHRWIYANAGAQAAWTKPAELRDFGAFRPGGNAMPLIFGLTDTADRLRASAVIHTVSLADRVGPGSYRATAHGTTSNAALATGSFQVEGCAHSSEAPGIGRLRRATELVLAVLPESLEKREGREAIRHQASLIAGALAEVSDGSSALGPQLMVLLLDNNARMLAALGSTAARPEDFSTPADTETWQAVANGYVFENLRLGELLAAAQIDVGGATALYCAMPVPVQSDAVLFGLRPWVDLVVGRLRTR